MCAPGRKTEWPLGVLAGAIHGLPLPYRGQAESPPLTQSELDTVPPGLCRALLIRSKLTRSVATVGSPMPHHSLGLAAYVQTTSPIRRYSDLLVHWQLKVRTCPHPCGNRASHPRIARAPLSGHTLGLSSSEATQRCINFHGLAPIVKQPSAESVALGCRMVPRDIQQHSDNACGGFHESTLCCTHSPAY